MTWEKAMEIYKQNCDSSESAGFYLSNQVKNNHRIAILASSSDTNGSEQLNDMVKSKIKSLALSIYRPNTGLQVKLETPDSILKKYKRVTPLEAKTHWNEQYQKSSTECTHVYRQGHCTNSRNCEIGLRTRKFYILAGSVLTVWTKVENVLCHLTGSSQFRLQIIRVKTSDNKIVGCVIPTMCLKQVDALLSSMSCKTYVHNHLNTSLAGKNNNNNNNINNLIVLDDDEEDDEKESNDSKGARQMITSNLNGVTDKLAINKNINSKNFILNVSNTKSNINLNNVVEKNLNTSLKNNTNNQYLKYDFT